VISYPAFLIDKRTGRTVDAELVEGISESDLQSVEADWRPVVEARLRELMAQGADRSAWPESSHWDWRRKVDRVRGYIAFRTMALLCEDQLQGLMMLAMAGHTCRIAEQARKDLVYVDYLESAPWNLKSIVAQPRFGGVGTMMIRAAIQVSREQDLQGRIGLHSLPAAERFYSEACVMTDLGHDGTYQGLKYFEMTAAQADAFSISTGT
jgi:hypothetical protein